MRVGQHLDERDGGQDHRDRADHAQQPGLGHVAARPCAGSPRRALLGKAAIGPNAVRPMRLAVRLARSRGRGPGHAHDGALPGRRPYRRLPAAVGDALGDGPAEAEPGLVDPVEVEAGAPGRARSPPGGTGRPRRPAGAVRRTCTQASPVPACAATLDSASRVAFAIAVVTRAGTTGAPSPSMSTWTLSPRPRMSATTARTSPARSPDARLASAAGSSWSPSASSIRATSWRHRLTTSAASSAPARARAVSVLRTVSCSRRSCSRRSMFLARMAYCSLAA